MATDLKSGPVPTYSHHLTLLGSIKGMKLSVSLPDTDVGFLDQVSEERNLPSRSAAVSAAVEALRNELLSEQYAAAFQEWEESGQAADWNVTVADGLDHDPTR
jgi:Arc/MetJ-type ribon-helix-helix transcriptional regulator